VRRGVSKQAARIVLTDDNFATPHGGAEDVWAERVWLPAPCQVHADLMRKTHNPAVRFMHCQSAFHDATPSWGAGSWNAPA
jgi:ornithine carbamoyltransferase